MEPLVRKESLFEGLKSDEQRRLYFLLLVADQLEPREALALAERIDAFITAKTDPRPDIADLLVCADAVASPDDRKSPIENGDGGEHGATNCSNVSPFNDETAQALPASPASPPATSPRLSRSLQIEFFKAIARGATNAELAERFGLTKRQAHALRIGLARRARAVGPASRIERQAAPEPSISSTRSSLLGQQKEFPLSQSPLPTATAEAEVIRFLRQIGDVVVKEHEDFLVNSILRLNFQELIGRANSKRLQRGKPTFEFPRVDAPAAVAASNGNGTGSDCA